MLAHAVFGKPERACLQRLAFYAAILKAVIRGSTNRVSQRLNTENDYECCKFP